MTTWTAGASGTATSIIGSTDQVLTTDTTDATFYFQVDAANLTGSDVLELRIYLTTLSSGTSRLAWKSVYTGSQTLPICNSPPLPSDVGISVAIRQTAGSPRTFPWKLLRDVIVAPALPSYYVATNGNNAWTGLLPQPNAGNTDGPFLTLAAAQTATHSGTIKRVSVRTGTYTLGANWAFTSADNNVTWCRFGNEVATIAGSSTWRVTATTVTNLTIKGLVFNQLLSGTVGGTAGGGIYFLSCTAPVFRWNTVQNGNGWLLTFSGTSSGLIDSNTFTGQTPGNPPGSTGNAYATIQLSNGSGNNTISHNLFTNNAGGGTSQERGASAPAQNNNHYDRNIYDGCCNSVTDMGAIYAFDLSTSGKDTGTQITNNIVRNNGSIISGVGQTGASVRGIYLDGQDASAQGIANVTITGNLCYSNIGVIPLQLSHGTGATNNVASNNIFAMKVMNNTDPVNWFNIETFGYQGGGAGNSFTHNIVYYYTQCHSPQWTTFGQTPAAFPSDVRNMYFSQTGATLFNNGNIVDSNPDNKNPLFTNAAAGDFTLQATSPAYADLGWVNLPTDQGPVAYVP